ncbi:MAG TPA: class F sortase [Acidimicrobiales bacterium]|nr:class F sortase [Acidimicrobiales bacterium]
MSIIALLLMTAGSLFGNTGIAADLPLPGGQVTVTTFTDGGGLIVDGKPVGQLAWGETSTVDRWSAGDHRVVLGPASGTVTVGPGCTVVVIVASLDGPSKPPTVTSHPACPTPRAGADRTVLRFVPAVARGSAPLGMTLAIGDIVVGPVAVGESSPHADVAAGLGRPWAVAINGQRIRAGARDLVAGHGVTAIFGGGGEHPATVVWIDDGPQPTSEPGVGKAPGTGVPQLNTDRGVGGATVAIIVLTSMALALVAGPRGRRALCALVVLTALAGCSRASAPREAGAPPRTTARPRPLTSHPPRADQSGVTAADVAVPVRLASKVASGPVVPVEARDVDRLPDLLRDPDIAWVAGSGPPGAGRGNTILAGHVVWGGRPGVFAHLDALQAGDPIVVTTSDGRERTYLVEGAIVAPKSEGWPAAWAPTGSGILTLVTCTGPIGNDGLHTQNLWLTAAAAPQ